MQKGEKTIQIEACLDRWAKQGDDAAFNDLVEHTFERLRVRAKEIVGKKLSRQDPMITGNTVAVEVYRKRLRKALESEKVNLVSAKDFFQLAAQHIHWEILDMLRRRPKAFSLDDAHNDPASSDPASSDPASNNLAFSADDEEQERALLLMEAIDDLPVEDRTVMDLHFINGLSQYETADKLGKTRNQVDSICRRIERTLGKALIGHVDRFQKTQRCKMCGKEFRTKGEKDRHELEPHPFDCPDCKRTFPSDVALEVHLRNAHFKCDFCDQRFSGATLLKVHEEDHS